MAHGQRAFHWPITYDRQGSPRSTTVPGPGEYLGVPDFIHHIHHEDVKIFHRLALLYPGKRERE